MYGSKKLFVLSLLSLISFSAYAEKHIVVAPQCLLKNVNYQTLSTKNAVSLISVDDDNLDKLITEKGQHQGKKPCGGFVNVTDEWEHYKNKSNPELFLIKQISPVEARFSAPSTPQHEKEVNQLLAQINPQNMWADLTALTSYPDRYARSQAGADAALWIKEQVETMAKNNNRDDVVVTLIKTGTNYKQPSVVAKIGKGQGPGIVIGGHMDTLSSLYERKPGADDDGTGTVTVLETARTLLASKMHFKKPIYLVWYAAEELGLIGSQYVVAEFKKNNIPVDAVIQFDMTGYAYRNDQTIWLVTDYVNKDLTNFLEKLVKTYVKKPIGRTACGYACSDHASWHKNGFAASMPFEAKFNNDNPNIHTSRDTMDILSLPHMTDFAKLSVAFAVELAEPVT